MLSHCRYLYQYIHEKKILLFLFIYVLIMGLRRVWRYQRGNQNPLMEEEQTTQCPREKKQTTIWKNIHIKLMSYIVTVWNQLFMSFLWNTYRRSIIFFLCYMLFLFKCLNQARKVSGHACILGVSIVHLSTILIVDFGIVLVLFRFLGIFI
jgi:hypothetical protein